jgi:hypothetical protein
MKNILKLYTVTTINEATTLRDMLLRKKTVIKGREDLTKHLLTQTRIENA